MPLKFITVSFFSFWRGAALWLHKSVCLSSIAINTYHIIKHNPNLALNPSVHSVSIATASEGLQIPAAQCSQILHIMKSSFSFRPKSSKLNTVRGSNIQSIITAVKVVNRCNHKTTFWQKQIKKWKNEKIYKIILRERNTKRQEIKELFQRKKLAYLE